MSAHDRVENIQKNKQACPRSAMELIFGATTDLAAWQLTLMAAISLAVGLSGGIVGIALGVIRLPMLTLFGVDPLIAAGTNLMISVMGSTIGTLEALLDQRVVPRVVIAMGGPAIVGAFIGGYFADKVPIWILLSVVSLLMAWSALFLIAWSIRLMRIRKRYPSARTRRAFTGGASGDGDLKLRCRPGESRECRRFRDRRRRRRCWIGPWSASHARSFGNAYGPAQSSWYQSRDNRVGRDIRVRRAPSEGRCRLALNRDRWHSGCDRHVRRNEDGKPFRPRQAFGCLSASLSCSFAPAVLFSAF